MEKEQLLQEKTKIEADLQGKYSDEKTKETVIVSIITGIIFVVIGVLIITNVIKFNSTIWRYFIIGLDFLVAISDFCTAIIHPQHTKKLKARLAEINKELGE